MQNQRTRVCPEAIIQKKAVRGYECCQDVIILNSRLSEKWYVRMLIYRIRVCHEAIMQKKAVRRYYIEQKSVKMLLYSRVVTRLFFGIVACQEHVLQTKGLRKTILQNMGIFKQSSRSLQHRIGYSQEDILQNRGLQETVLQNMELWENIL